MTVECLYFCLLGNGVRVYKSDLWFAYSLPFLLNELHIYLQAAPPFSQAPRWAAPLTARHLCLHYRVDSAWGGAALRKVWEERRLARQGA